MSVNSHPQHHKMECVRLDQNKKNDWVFEFLCPNCGYTAAIPLFEILASGELDVSHGDDKDGQPSILITLKQNETDLPECFKDFLNELNMD